jgi:hypothetical protein
VIATWIACPCIAELGAREIIVGPVFPCVTVNAFVSVTTSPPVATVTLLGPMVAVAAIFTIAVALVAELTVSDATVIPALKLAVVVPCTKWVY